MLRAYDYRCIKCQAWSEIFLDETEPVEMALECPRCGSQMRQRWRTAPGVIGGGGEFYSEQLQMRFSSRSAFKDYLKRNDLELAGPEELHRTESTFVPDRTEEKKDDARLLEVMEESWQKCVVGRQVEPPLATINDDDGDIYA